MGIEDHMSWYVAHVVVHMRKVFGNRDQMHCAWMSGWVVGFVWHGLMSSLGS